LDAVSLADAQLGLRAVASLARLLRDQSRLADASALLESRLRPVQRRVRDG